MQEDFTEAEAEELKNKYKCSCPTNGYCDGKFVSRLLCPAIQVIDNDKLCVIGIENAI